MDFSNHNARSQGVSVGKPASGSSNQRKELDKGKWGRVGFVVAVTAVVILITAAICVAAFGGNNKAEKEYVDSSRLQAVFLNTGQVYFGNVKSLNDRYFVLSNIYYLQTANANAANDNNKAGSNVSLVKLGCELHEPYDQMVINSDQVTFWENLQDNGQVAKAVLTFEKQNPNGQKCTDQSASSSTNSSNAAQNAGSSSSTPAAKP